MTVSPTLGRAEDTRLALIVGIRDYQSPDFPPLPTVNADLRRIREVLEASDYTIVDEVTGEKATNGYLAGRIDNFVATAPEGSTVVVYVNGHGLNVGDHDYFVPYDAYSRDHVESHPEALVGLDLAASVRRSSAAAVVLLADCCREGVATGAKAVMRPSFGASLSRVERSKLASIFGCQAGEYCYFSESAGYSLFTEALARALAPDSTARTVHEVTESADRELQKLVAAVRPGSQQHLNVGATDLAVSDHVLCHGRPDRWRSVVSNCPLWKRAAGAVDDRVRAAVEELASLAWARFQVAGSTLPRFPWRDPGLPERCLKAVADLLPDGAELDPVEAAVLIAAPFLREAVLCAGLTELSGLDPLDVTSDAIDSPARRDLDAAYQVFPRLIAKAAARPETEHAAIAGWLLNRHLLRHVDLWRGEVAGDLSRQLAWALVVPGSANKVAAQLRAVAASVATGRDNFDRESDSDKPALYPEQTWSSPARTSHRVREEQLAVLLGVAGLMALDPRQMHEAVANQIGVRDGIQPVDVLSTIDQTVWHVGDDGETLELAAACPHPAIHVAWQAQAALIDELLGWLHDRDSDGGSAGHTLLRLPRRVSIKRLEAQCDADGTPEYEIPPLSFRLDHDEIRELLMGVRLYGEPGLAIREMYQNALDACRYRQARAAYAGQDYEGRIIFREGMVDGRPYIECEDNGVGMGRRELEQLFSRAGRRFVNSAEFLWERAKWRSERPDIKIWPNSRFGIGVFSYFMLADEITVTSARVDRKLVPGQLLRVDISSSGSVFRIRAVDDVSPGGTTVRLYLRPGEVSAIGTLRALLWYSEFEVRCESGDDRETWPARRLHAATAPPPLVGPDDGDEVWFVDGEGPVLADGIDTGVRHFGYVVNLARDHAPVLSVDRNTLESWDGEWVRQRVTEAAPAIAAGDRLSYAWLWRMVADDPVLGQEIWARLAEAGTGLPLRSPDARPKGGPDGGPDVPAEQARWPVRALGGFPMDGELTVRRRRPRGQPRPNPGGGRLNLAAGVDWDAVTLLRLGVLGRTGWPLASFAELAADRASAASSVRVAESLCPDDHDALPVFAPVLHALITDNSHLAKLAEWAAEPPPGPRQSNTPFRIVPFDDDEVPPAAMLMARAMWLSRVAGWDAGWLLRQLRALVVVGYRPPRAQRAPVRFVADWVDVDLAAATHRAPEDARSRLRIVATLAEASARRGMTIGDLADRLGTLRDLGLAPADVTVPGAVRDLVCTDDLAAGMRSLMEWLGWWPTMSWLNLVAAIEVAGNDRRLLELLRTVAPPPWTEAELDRASRGLVDHDDLLLLSRDRDELPPWIAGEVPLWHVYACADLLGLQPAEVHARIDRYAGELGLTLPALGPRPADPYVEEDEPDDVDEEPDYSHLPEIDRILLSENLDPKTAHLTGQIPAAHVAAVASFLDQSIGQVMARLTKLAPSLPIAPPELTDGSVLELVPSKDDVIMLSLDIDGVAPWLDEAPSVLHLARVAMEIRKPLGWVCRHLNRLAPLVPELPRYDPDVVEQTLGVRPEPRDLVILSAELRLGGASLAGPVPRLHLLRAAARFATSSAGIAARLDRFAPLGLDLPELPAGDWSLEVPTWQDLLIVTVDCAALEALPAEPVPALHVARCGYTLDVTEDVVLDRLRLWRPLFGYSVPLA
jgi:hypothetical protein